MAKEYVVTVATRDTDHPLESTVHLEFGVRTSDPRALKESLESIVGLLGHLVTPEAVSKYLRQNIILANLKILARG